VGDTRCGNQRNLSTPSPRSGNPGVALLMTAPPRGHGEGEAGRVQERDLPAGREVNRFETKILTSLKEPELLAGRAGEVD
jgi:hypothetical protein